MVAFLIVFIVAILIYSNTLFAPFHFDDESNITRNNAIKNLENFWPLSGMRYIGFLSFALNYYLGGLNVLGYHIVNLVIHIVNGLLVLWLVLLTFKTPMLEGNNQTFQQVNFIALFSALIFISHPIQTQAVTYIVQRFTSLATLFYLLSLVFYIKSRLSFQTTTLNSSREHRNFDIKAWAFYLLSLFCTVLAMKTKEITFTLPFLITLYEFVFFNTTLSSSSPSFTKLKRFSFLMPYLMALLIIPFSLINIERPFGDIIGGLSETTQETDEISRISYLLTQFRVIMTYIRLLFLPINQNLDYDYPIYHSLTLEILLSLLFIILLLCLAVYFFYKSQPRNHRLGLIAFGIFWFFITLSVESSLIPISDVIAEHRLYLPSVGAIIAFSSTILIMLDYAKPRFSSLFFYPVMLVIAVLPLGIATYHRNFTWADEVTLWEDVVKKSPYKIRGYIKLGNIHLLDRRLDEAIKEYQAALNLRPDSAEAHNNLALAYNQQGRLEEAIQEYKAAIKLKLEFPELHYRLALAYYQQGNLEEATKEYLTALNLKPDYAEAHNSLGNIYFKQNRLEEAIYEYTIALGLKTNYAEAHNNLGVAYAKQGHLEVATQEYKAAIKIKPQFSEAYNNLGDIYFRQGQLEEAINEYTTAVRLRPNFVKAHYNLGSVYKLKGVNDEARRQFEIVLALQPDFVAAQQAIESLESNHQPSNTLPQRRRKPSEP